MNESDLTEHLSRWTGDLFSPKVWGVILVIGIVLGGFYAIQKVASSVSRISPTINTVTTPDPTTVAEYKKLQENE